MQNNLVSIPFAQAENHASCNSGTSLSRYRCSRGVCRCWGGLTAHTRSRLHAGSLTLKLGIMVPHLSKPNADTSRREAWMWRTRKRTTSLDLGGSCRSTDGKIYVRLQSNSIPLHSSLIVVVEVIELSTYLVVSRTIVFIIAIHSYSWA